MIPEILVKYFCVSFFSYANLTEITNWYHLYSELKIYKSWSSHSYFKFGPISIFNTLLNTVWKQKSNNSVRSLLTIELTNFEYFGSLVLQNICQNCEADFVIIKKNVLCVAILFQITAFQIFNVWFFQWSVFLSWHSRMMLLMRILLTSKI